MFNRRPFWDRQQPKGRATARPFGDRARLRPRSQSRDMIVHIHTSPFTFTRHQPKGRATARPFGDHTRLGPRCGFQKRAPSKGEHCPRRLRDPLLSTLTPPVEFWDTHRHRVTLLSTPTPPVEFWDTATHRQRQRERERVSLYGGGGNYVHQNSVISYL